MKRKKPQFNSSAGFIVFSGIRGATMHSRSLTMASHATTATTTNKSIPFLSTAELAQLNSPPPRASSLRGKLNSMHRKIEKRYEIPTRPAKEQRVTLAQKYSQKHRRPVQSVVSSSKNIIGKMTSMVNEDTKNQSPEARAKQQLRAQQRKGADRRGGSSKNSSPTSKGGKIDLVTHVAPGGLTKQNMKTHEAENLPVREVTRQGSRISPDKQKNNSNNQKEEDNNENDDKDNDGSISIGSISNNGYDLDEIPEYGSEDDLDWGSDSDSRGLQDDYEARTLLATPQSPRSPLETTTKGTFFEEFRKLSRRNETKASTMSADYLSSVIASGLPPEPLHVGRGKELHKIADHFRENDFEGERLASLDAKFDLRGLKMGDGYVNGVGSSLKHGGSGTCSLLLGNNRISPRGASSLLDQLGNSNFSTVLHLDLSDNNIGMNGVKALVEGVTKLPGYPGSLRIRHLDVSKNNLNDTQLSTLVHGFSEASPYNRTLRTFVANHNTGSRQTCIALENYLASDHTLKSLSLAWNRLGTQGGSSMLASGLLENNSLKVLDLSWNSLGSSSDFILVGEAISRHLVLEHVDLSHNHITSENIVTLSNDMDKNHSILGIHLKGNAATVDSLGFITAYEDSSSLSTSNGGIGRPKENYGGNKRKFRKQKNKKNRKKWKAKNNKSSEKIVIQQVLHALFMLWMESGVKPAQIFEKMDADNDGTVTASEFCDGLKMFGLNIGKSDASIVFKEMDKDNSGGLVYKELLESIQEAGKHPPPLNKGNSSDKHSKKIKNNTKEDADLYRSQVENGKLTKLDHIHSSHLLKDPRGGGKKDGRGGGYGIMSELGRDAIHSCCWVCSGYKEEVFTFNIPRGSADEALEHVAICFDFEDYIPRGTEKKDDRTSTKGGVSFVARRVVPPGDLKFYFLIDGVARHNPDEPSTALNVASMINKKRSVTSKGNSWSKVASKYSKRPRCNTRSVPFRTGYLVTRSLPRPTGLNWADLKDIEDDVDDVDEIEAEELAQAEANDALTEAADQDKLKRKEKEKVRIINAGKTSEIIAHIWQKKARYDKLQHKKKRNPITLAAYNEQFFRTEFGVELGGKRLMAFEQGVKANWKKSPRIRWFATLIGWAPLRIDKDFDTPTDMDASLAYSSVLMTCLPLDLIEERLVAVPCMVDFEVLIELLDAGNKVDYDLSDRLGGWEDEDKDQTNQIPVFDAHFLATSAYQILINELRQHEEKSFHTSLIDLDIALDIIMTTWYRWKIAPETCQIEEDVKEVEKPIIKVSTDVKNMLSSTRSFFDCRHSVSWSEEQMLDAQNACFEADWLRCTEGPLKILVETLDFKEKNRMHTMLRTHYGKLEHIFSLYAAADGGPFELGKYGARQLFRDLKMILSPQEEEEMKQAEEEEKNKKQLLKKKKEKVGVSLAMLDDRSTEELLDGTDIIAPDVVLSAKTTLIEFQSVWEKLMSRSGLMPDEGLRLHHFIGLLILLAQQRYHKKYTPAVSLRYMLTWEICRGQIDYNPRRFRTAILYTPAITTVLSLHGHDLQTLFVARANSITFHEFRLDTGSAYMTFEQFRDLLRARGLTDFAGVSEPHTRLAFIASQDNLVDEAHTHPPGLLLDEFCEAIVRIAYSMLLTAEERVTKNKRRLKRVARNRRRQKRRWGVQNDESSKENQQTNDIHIEMDRIVNALRSTINILIGSISVTDDPNHMSQQANVPGVGPL
jgi:hypothetical protein